ncbi:MAG: DNA polymerase III subunit delta, partial [Micavibrio sp.]|nr:DNA polymerase III subunit delta [Micavibrio sp.]
MKLSYREIEPFVKQPNPAARVILVYGPDYGLVKERAQIMGKTVIADLNDPFNAVTLSTDIILTDPARLNDEANAMSMMGGDRLIRVDNASDKLTTYLKVYLENPSNSALVILEA